MRGLPPQVYDLVDEDLIAHEEYALARKHRATQPGDSAQLAYFKWGMSFAKTSPCKEASERAHKAIFIADVVRYHRFGQCGRTPRRKADSIRSTRYSERPRHQKGHPAREAHRLIIPCASSNRRFGAHKTRAARKYERAPAEVSAKPPLFKQLRRAPASFEDFYSSRRPMAVVY